MLLIILSVLAMSSLFLGDSNEITLGGSQGEFATFIQTPAGQQWQSQAGYQNQGQAALYQLYTQALQNGALQKGALQGGYGGDNGWNTGISSGNYYNGGAGYVQTPNGGFVSHGM